MANLGGGRYACCTTAPTVREHGKWVFVYRRKEIGRLTVPFGVSDVSPHGPCRAWIS